MSARKQTRLALEALENRTVPAGNIFASVVRGDLVLLGDRFDNQVAIDQIDLTNTIRVTPLEGTTLNGRTEAVEFNGVTRDVRVKLLGGDDTLHVFDVDVPRDLNVLLGRGTDVFTRDQTVVGRRLATSGAETTTVDQAGAEAVFAGATGVGRGVTQGGVMQVKLNQAIQMLTKPRLGEEQYMQAIDEAMEAIYTSNLVVLPTFEDPATEQAFQQHRQMAQQAIDALTNHINGTTPTNQNPNSQIGTPESKTFAAEARNFIQVAQEAMAEIGTQTAQCNPQNPNSPSCQLLQQTDEGGDVVDTVLNNLASRNVRSPFFLLPRLRGAPDEEVIVPGVVGPDECGVVMKEMQGLKAIVTPKQVPIWVEPWFARRTIVGFRTVWVWEFVPAEFIKTISFCNVPTDPMNPAGGREIDVNVETLLVIERQLLHFWRYIDKDVTAVG
jgi:hypothetical protein